LILIKYGSIFLGSIHFDLIEVFFRRMGWIGKLK